MSEEDMLLQDEVDALMSSVSGDAGAALQTIDESCIRPYDPAKQHRVIRERLHALDIINERFARQFRISLFNLIRRNADITIDSLRYQSYSDFSRKVPVPTNINLVALKPLQGTALVVFPPNLVFMVVDNLFGGDGRFVTKSEGREFTNTEHRIIRRLLKLATDAYEAAWKSIYPLHISYVRSEMQAKFANITNSPNDIVVNTSFHLEVGGLSSDFQICIPYTMIEPLRELLTNPAPDSQVEEGVAWSTRLASELKASEVELIADFVSIPSTIGEVLELRAGDVLPITLPDSVVARVDGIPVTECGYGSRNERRALRITRMIDHSPDYLKQSGNRQEPTSSTEESNHD